MTASHVSISRCFFSKCYRDHRDLPSFPTRRSSDLDDFLPRRRRDCFICGEFECAVSRGISQLDHEIPDCLPRGLDRKSTRLNSSHRCISYAVFCLKKKTQNKTILALCLLSCLI